MPELGLFRGILTSCCTYPDALSRWGHSTLLRWEAGGFQVLSSLLFSPSLQKRPSRSLWLDSAEGGGDVHRAQKSLKFRTRVKPEFGSQVEAEIKTNYRAAEPRPACSPGSFWSFFFIIFGSAFIFLCFYFLLAILKTALFAFLPAMQREAFPPAYMYILRKALGGGRGAGC